MRLQFLHQAVELLEPPYDASDPSEMVASIAIGPAIHARFDIAWERPYWGNLLYPVLSHVSANAGTSPDAEEILGTLIERGTVATVTSRRQPRTAIGSETRARSNTAGDMACIRRAKRLQTAR